MTLKLVECHPKNAIFVESLFAKELTPAEIHKMQNTPTGNLYLQQPIPQTKMALPAYAM